MLTVLLLLLAGAIIGGTFMPLACAQVYIWRCKPPVGTQFRIGIWCILPFTVTVEAR